MVTPTTLATTTAAAGAGAAAAGTAATAATAGTTLASLTQLASLGAAGAGVYANLKTKKPGELPKAPQLEIAPPRLSLGPDTLKGRSGLITTGPTGLPTKGSSVKRGLIGA